MTRREFETLIKAIVPQAQFELDSEDQIVIYTNLIEDMSMRQLIDMEN